MINISLHKNDLIKPLSKIQSIVDRKTIMNIINNVYLYTDNSFLYLEATDLEISFRGKVPCSIKSNGSITVNAKKLYEIVKEFPTEILNFEEKENLWLNITSTNNVAKYKLGGLPADDFPKFKQLKNDLYTEVPSNIVREMIEKTIFSVSNDDKKLSLTGILLEKKVEGDDKEGDGEIKLKMVSSDGHRLNLCEKYLPTDQIFMDNSILIPKKGALEIKKITEDNETVKFGQDDNFCYIEDETNSIVIRLLKEIFPEYKEIIPKSKKRYFSFKNQDVYNALKRISIFSSDTDFRGVKLNIEKNSMVVSLIDNRIGEATEYIDIDYEGENFSFALNAKYLMEALNIMDSEKIDLIINDDASPCVIKGDKDIGFTGIIMPMTIGNK